MSLLKYQNWSSATSIRFKTKTSCDLVTLVFPRFMQFACFYFEFALDACPWYFSSYTSLAFEIALVLISRRSIEKCSNVTYHTYLLYPQDALTEADPGRTQDICHLWPQRYTRPITPIIFFQSLKVTCHRKVLGSNSHLKSDSPLSYVNLTSLYLLILCEHFPSMVVYFIASS